MTDEVLMADEVLDTKNLNCPLPILKAKKAIHTLATGQTLRVLSTDPGSVKDFEAFCRTAGHQLLESNEKEGVFNFVIRKA